MSKPTKEEKAAFKALRSNVIAVVESLRKHPVEGRERRHLQKEPFAPNPMHPEPVEIMCDFIEANAAGVTGVFEKPVPEASVRALWYCFACWRPPKEAKPSKKGSAADAAFDPYAETDTVFDVDIRDLRNVHMVAQTLLLYLHDSRDSLFADAAYTAFVTASKSDEAAVAALLRPCTPLQLQVLQRVAICARHVAGHEAAASAETTQARLDLVQATLQPNVARVIGPALIRHPSTSAEHDRNSQQLRSDAFYTLTTHQSALLPMPFTGSATRVGQALHYRPRILRANEWDILTEGGELVHFTHAKPAVEENVENHFIYRVVEGSFSVFVGKTKVATLVTNDWFGEMSILGNNFSRARVVADKKASAIRVLDTKLNAVLLARSDLSAAFYGVMAFDLASRLNVALVQSTRALVDTDIAVDPSVGMYASRHVIETRVQASNESRFMYNAETHAVRAFSMERVPKKAGKRSNAGFLYVFSTQLVSLYYKGHSEKKTVVALKDLRSVKQEPMGSLVYITYVDGKKEKSMQHKLANAELAKCFMAVLDSISKAQQGVSTLPVPSVRLMRAVALFPLASSDPQVLSLVRGHSYTLLDSVGSGTWFYGFNNQEPDRKGLIAASYVEVRPHGALLPGVMQPSHWHALKAQFITQSFAAGTTVIEEGNPVSAGHLWYIVSGELSVQRRRDNGLVDKLNTVGEGDTLGELIFLLGGRPRLSVVVTSERAVLHHLPKERLNKLLEDAKFASPFWKYMCCILSSRLGNLQLRLATSSPPVPVKVPFVVLEDQQAAAAALGSPPSLPELPPPPAAVLPAVPDISPEDELKARIAKQGFFLGVDSPSDVDRRQHELEAALSKRHEAAEVANEAPVVAGK